MADQKGGCKGGWKCDLRNGWPLAVSLDSFPYPWVVLLIQHIHHLIVCSGLIQQGKHLEREAALGLCSGTLDERYNLQTRQSQH